MMRLLAAWRAADTEILPALRTLYSYTDREPDRATGWLYSAGQYGQLAPRPWPDALAGHGPVLLDALERDIGVRFTACAFQAYRDGAGVDWHHDRDWPVQAILSLGVTRSFGIRSDGGTSVFRVAHGDLVFMPAGFQQEYEHCVPAEDVPGERCSLVFRTT